MELELPFNGSPGDFGLLAHELSRRAKRSMERPLSILEIYRVENWKEVKANTDINPVIVHIAGEIIVTAKSNIHAKSQTQLSYLARVEAYRMPDGISHLLVTCPDEDWPIVERRWNDLYEKMRQQGWLDPVQPAQQASPLPSDAEGEQSPQREHQAGQVVLEEPERDAPADEWIIWWYQRIIRYYEQGCRGHRPSLKEVTEKTEYSYNGLHVRKSRDLRHRFDEYEKRLTALKAALKHPSPECADGDS